MPFQAEAETDGKGRWLMLKGRQEDALRSLARLHSCGNREDAFVQGEFADMQAKVIQERDTESSWREVRLNKGE